MSLPRYSLRTVGRTYRVWDSEQLVLLNDGPYDNYADARDRINALNADYFREVWQREDEEARERLMRERASRCLVETGTDTYTDTPPKWRP